MVRYDPKLTPAQIRHEIRKTWLGLFDAASPSVWWQEPNSWNVEASVEYDDGKHATMLMDGSHVAFQDQYGFCQFMRLLSATD